MVLLIGDNPRLTLALRRELLLEGLLSETATASEVPDKICRISYIAAVFLEPEHPRVMKELAFFLSRKQPAMIRLAIYGDDCGIYGCDVCGTLLDGRLCADTAAAELGKLIKRLSRKSNRFDSNDMIATTVRIVWQDGNIFYRMIRLQIRRPSGLALVRALIRCYPEALTTDSLMRLCFEPLGIVDKTVVSRTVRTINTYYDMYGLRRMIAYDRGRGYFLDAR